MVRGFLYPFSTAWSDANLTYIMTTPASTYEIDMESARRLREQTWSFTLSPDLWDNLDIQEPLTWSRVIFDETSVNQIPNDQIGVYAFVLEHNTANLKLAYLLYVGQTRRNFRSRYGKYKRHQREERTNRYLVKQMLTTWPGRLAFYYSRIHHRDFVKPIEDELIAAFKPPVCREYPAKVRRPFKILDDR